MESHTQEESCRIYKCQFCSFSSPSKFKLRKHKLEVGHLKFIRDKVLVCPICSLEMTGNRKLARHIRQHQYENGYACKYCGKKFEERHQAAAHTARCKNNPNYKTTVAHDRIKIKERLKNGLPMETRAKISASMKRHFFFFFQDASYKYNHYSKGSWAEDYFRDLFEKENITGYECQYRVSRYRLDFAFIEKQIDFEVDGHQHRADKRIVLHDKERTENLLKLGWTTIRVDWSYFRSLSTDGRKEWLEKNLYPFI